MNIEIDQEHTQIAAIETRYTGGNIYNDIITLKNGMIIAISDGIGIYNSIEDYDCGNYMSIT